MCPEIRLIKVCIGAVTDKPTAVKTVMVMRTPMTKVPPASQRDDDDRGPLAPYLRQLFEQFFRPARSKASSPHESEGENVEPEEKGVQWIAIPNFLRKTAQDPQRKALNSALTLWRLPASSDSDGADHLDGQLDIGIGVGAGGARFVVLANAIVEVQPFHGGTLLRETPARPW